MGLPTIGAMAAVSAAAGGGFCLGMYIGNDPHRAVHRAIEGRPDAGVDPNSHDPAGYNHAHSHEDGLHAAVVGGAMTVGALAVGAGARYGVGHVNPALGRLGALAGVACAIGVVTEMFSALGESNASDPSHHIDFPAFL